LVVLTSPLLGEVFPLLVAERPHAVTASGTAAMRATTVIRLRFLAISPPDPSGTPAIVR
jgi:hypothetical protein